MDWLNKNWKKYLEANDKILLHTVVDDNVIKINSLLGAVFVSLFFGFWVFGANFISSGNLVASIFFAVLVFLVFCVLMKMFIEIVIS